MRRRFYFILLTLAWLVLPAATARAFVQTPSQPPVFGSGGVNLNPTTGRFWTADSYEGRNEDPLSLHKYLYCYGDPVNGMDPTGRENLTTIQIATAISVCLNTSFAVQAYRQGSYVEGTIDLIAAGFGVFGLFGNILPPTYALASSSSAVANATRQAVIVASGFSILISATELGTAVFQLAGEDHHIMTDKNNVSTDPDGTGPYTPKFKELLEGTGIDFQDVINRVRVVGHQGPHPEANRYTYEALENAVRGLPRKSTEYTEAIQKGLEKLAREAKTPGTTLNKMITGQYP